MKIEFVINATVITAALMLAFSVLAWLMVYGIRIWAMHRKVLDIPNDRSSHTSPVPRGGGLAIVALSVGGWWSYQLWSGTPSAGTIYSYMTASVLIALVSWIDDLRGLTNSVRFSVHLLSAILIVIGIGAAWKTVALPFVGDVSLGIPGTVLALFWIVGLINTYNFMDGIDGIAGAQALMAGVGWMILGVMSDQPECAALGLLLSASTMGFLWWNLPPARIFMGDVGSAFLGFSFCRSCRFWPRKE